MRVLARAEQREMGNVAATAAHEVQGLAGSVLGLLRGWDCCCSSVTHMFETGPGVSGGNLTRRLAEPSMRGPKVPSGTVLSPLFAQSS